MDVNSTPNPLACCALCTGDASQSLYSDVARTEPAQCPIFFMTYALGLGWICQFHALDATVAPSDASVPSIAYLPL